MNMRRIGNGEGLQTFQVLKTEIFIYKVLWHIFTQQNSRTNIPLLHFRYLFILLHNHETYNSAFHYNGWKIELFILYVNKRCRNVVLVYLINRENNIRNLFMICYNCCDWWIDMLCLLLFVIHLILLCSSDKWIVGELFPLQNNIIKLSVYW